MPVGTTIAITGATGHLAASIIPVLIRKGYNIRALQYEQALPFREEKLEIIRGSILDPPALHTLVDGCDIVIHAAAKISINSNQDASVYAVNVNGTKNLLDAAQKANVKRFIYLSSIHAYRQFPVHEMLDETQAYCDHRSPRYDQSKRDAQQYVLQHLSGPTEVVVLNPTSVIGPNDYKPSLLGKAVIDMYNGKIPALISGGFDFCDVRDVAEGIVNAIDQGRHGHAYLLGGSWYSVVELHQLIMEIKGTEASIPVLPPWAGYLGLPFIKMMASLQKTAPLYTKESLDALKNGNRHINSQKASQELGYFCRPLRETITDTISWFKQAGYLS